MIRNTLPFTISKTDNFFDKLGDYIGDVFYDILPEKGYELRDEQIYMAYQIEQAFKNKDIVFAEAGVGTGKTFVYLIYAICYARYTRKPAIISCADETLIEQLVKEGGDIDKLEKALGLKVDVRLAKAREQYVCVRKLDKIVQQTIDPDIERVHDAIPDFVYDTSSSMQSFSPYGDRKEYPWVNNETWEKVAWDPLQQCATCDWRHRSGQTLNRDYYRHASDLIICSHDFFMEHIWTKESRKREGQMPLLPEASCVVFDEGHLLEFAAQKGLTYRFDPDNLTNALTGYSSQDVREETLYLIEEIIYLHDDWFKMLKDTSITIEGSNRREVVVNGQMKDIVEKLKSKVSDLLEQLVFDSELFTIDAYHVKIIEEYIEHFDYGLTIFLKEDSGIFWLEETEGQYTFVIMPRLVEDILKEEVFSQKIPFIFSSATLAQAGDFSYIAKSLGISKFDSFNVDSPFDYEEQMELQAKVSDNEIDKWNGIGKSLNSNNGGSLLLFASKEEMNRYRLWAEKQEWNFDLYYEGDKEISTLVRQFQTVENAVLCSYNLWEGLDVPGKALTQVIIASLPFPALDPVFQAKRKHADHPMNDVDIPFMLLRLRQGVGRLIRSRSDAGKIQLWMTTQQMDEHQQAIAQVMPTTIVYPN
ncbi:ATP-dependent DNA helicase [Radiobacillus sp. PE A8.2]|uniref:ATP-dependent DNA helicase n=1 Tax=Radiobacillus sp. PE A8.2 TaxID=3380349 RepID=UPI00388E059E